MLSSGTTRSLLFLFCLAASSFAQETTGAIVGVIKDSSGSVIAGAQIIAVRLDTGVESRAASDDEGNYQFPLMRAGQYRITVEAPGFQKMLRENVTVNTTERLRLDMTLTVGQLTETVSVTAETPLLQSEKATVGQVVEQRPFNPSLWPHATSRRFLARRPV